MCAPCRCLVCTSVIKINPLYLQVLFWPNWCFPFSQYRYQRRRIFKDFPLNYKQFSIDAFFPISIDGGGVSGFIDITRFELILSKQIFQFHLDTRCRFTASFWITSPYVKDCMNTASAEITLPSRIQLWTIARMQHEFVCVLVVRLGKTWKIPQQMIIRFQSKFQAWFGRSNLGFYIGFSDGL